MPRTCRNCVRSAKRPRGQRWDGGQAHRRRSTGDIRSVGRAIAAAVEIQRQLSAHNEATTEPLRVRIGISAGEPVAENRDLFGAAVQLASRLCERAQPGIILVSSAVRDLAIGKDFIFERRRTLRLKGFDEAVRFFDIAA